MSFPVSFQQIDEIFGEKLKQYARGQGLEILSTAWEDTGRSKNSCWGPNISDMTLTVDNTRMPIIRQPNFQDVSADLAIEKFNVTVGNETGSNPHRIPLKQYINEIGKWACAPGLKNYLLERDSRILTSAQCCVLPLRDGKVEFAVELYNYQNRREDPAVLVIVSSTAGTSAQVLDRGGKVLFQKKDRALNYMICRSQDFVVERVAELKKERPDETVEVLEKEARAEALERGCVQIFQIPLKQRPPPAHRSMYEEVHENLSYGSKVIMQGLVMDKLPAAGMKLEKLVNKSEMLDASAFKFVKQAKKLPDVQCGSVKKFVQIQGASLSQSGGDLRENLNNYFKNCSLKPGAAALPARGVEAGVVQEGSDVGPWTGIPAGAAWERDERFPIRATIQFYTVTDTLEVDEQVFREFAGKIRDVFSYGSHQGSLVTATSNRVTEPALHQAPSSAPEALAANPLGPWASASSAQPQ
jgi:hypothetical protein